MPYVVSSTVHSNTTSLYTKANHSAHQLILSRRSQSHTTLSQPSATLLMSESQFKHKAKLINIVEANMPAVVMP